MKRILYLTVAAAILVMALAPALADTEANHCSATSAATVSPLIGATAPVCTFEITCTGATLGCAYLIALDSNGTGSVAGGMTATVVGPGTSSHATFGKATGGSAPAPSCSGLFQCHYASTKANPVLLFVTGATGTGVAVKITCAGGGISALETVGCNLSAVEFGPF
jgi:hypothetical protein